MESTQAPALTIEEIIKRHHHVAWAAQFMARHEASSGRYTKAKERRKDIAEATASAMDRLVKELREAGLDIPE